MSAEMILSAEDRNSHGNPQLANSKRKINCEVPKPNCCIYNVTSKLNARETSWKKE